MNNKIDPRFPRDLGSRTMASSPAIRTPWEKLISFYDAVHFSNRYGAVLSAAILQAFRILEPDYEKRAQMMCTQMYEHNLHSFSGALGPRVCIGKHNVHPFCKGNFVGCLNGDSGDDRLLMCGRVNDFGTYRVEKELDVCDWDIVGTELCRATTSNLQGVCDGTSNHLRPGPMLELHMVEAKGAGHRHCRIVGECREKFPMPEHERWQCMGPIATADQIKYTPEENTVSESQVFRADCDYTFRNGTCMEEVPDTSYPGVSQVTGAFYIFPAIEKMVKDGTLDSKFVDHVIHCVCEAAGKAAFGDFYAKKGLKDWIGAPADLEDGRLMGGYLETVLQCTNVSYEIEAFNKDEVIYVIDRTQLCDHYPRQTYAYLWFWYGATKSLVNAQWSLWEDAEGVAPDKLRIVIGKKVDQFC